MPDNGVYISELTNTTNVTDDTLFITDDTENTYNIKASDVASYVSGKVLPEAESYSDDNKTAAIAEAKEYTDSVVSNPNLLINGDFQVWQRGTSFSQTSFTERYTADRWCAVSTNGAVKLTVQKSDRGMELFADQSGSGVQIRYRMADEDLAGIRGKTCTLSYSIDGVITTRQITVSETEQETDILFSISITVSTTQTYLNWVKLEIGTVATQFVPRPYAEELAMCRYYYRKYASIVLNGISNVTGASLTVSLPDLANMRASYTISGSINWVRGEGGIASSLATVDVGNNYAIILIYETANTLTPLTSYTALLNNVVIDAEIYP